ncbi:MAG TPA: FAD-dependent oxidoreductase [Labilithrix sp.]
MKTKIVVIGGGYAGLLCALRLPREADVVLVEARPWFVERVRLHEDVAGTPRPRRALAELLRGSGVGLRIGWVRAVDLEARRLRFEDGEEEAFDELVVATGSRASAGGVPGLELAHACDTEESATKLRGNIEVTIGNIDVTIVGGGLTGLELAAEIAERRHARVTLVTADALGGSGLGKPARAYARSTLEALGVAIVEHERAAAVEPDAVVLASGRALPSALTIWAGGLEPTPLARDAGLAVDETDRALVDDRLRSLSHPFVHVAGDAARVAIDGATLRMACATALPMGAYCADDLARTLRGADPRPFRFSYLLQCASLGRRAAVVQLVDAHDAPSPTFLGGRPAAWIKEALCRYTMASMSLERRGIHYRWPRARAPAAPQLVART